MRRVPAALLFAAVLTTIPALRAVAQRAAVLTGTVRDSAGAPVADVDIRVLTQNIAARTDYQGRFVIEGLELAWHRVLYRRIGYQRVEAEYEVQAGGLAVAVVLAALPDTLAPVVVTGRRWTGVFGVVADLQLRPVPGAQVESMGSSKAVAVTDSAGRFRLPELLAGSHILLIRRLGYYPVQRSITLARGESQELSLLLSPLPDRWANSQGHSGLAGRQAYAWAEHASRRLRCAGQRARAVLVTREELAPLSDLPLDLALRRVVSVTAKGHTVSEFPRYAMFVDGFFTDWPLVGVRADDVEAVEIYGGPILPSFPGGFGWTTAWLQTVNDPCPLRTVWIWMREDNSL